MHQLTLLNSLYTNRYGRATVLMQGKDTWAAVCITKSMKPVLCGYIISINYTVKGKNLLYLCYKTLHHKDIPAHVHPLFRMAIPTFYRPQVVQRHVLLSSSLGRYSQSKWLIFAILYGCAFIPVIKAISNMERRIGTELG